MDLNFFGKQGSGKGTQARIIAEQFGYKIFETGQALRDIAKEDSPLGREVNSIMQAGKLVPIEIVVNVLEDFVKKANPEEKIIFDGIPRSLEQKEHFDKISEKYNRSVLNILIDISDQEALTRLSARKICDSCRKVYGASHKGKYCPQCGQELTQRLDDNPEAIKQRLAIYASETRPVIQEYESQQNMITINGENDIEAITAAINKEIKNKS